METQAERQVFLQYFLVLPKFHKSFLITQKEHGEYALYFSLKILQLQKTKNYFLRPLEVTSTKIYALNFQVLLLHQ